MYQLKEILLIYLTGGLTFVPILLAVIYFSSSTYKAPLPAQQSTQEEEEKERPRNPYAQQEKKGWIRLTKGYKPKGTSESNVAVLMFGIQSYVQGSKRPKEYVYAQLKCGALFIYESDQPNEECKIIIPIHNYTVSIYPEKRKDHDIFGRSVALRLTPKKNNPNNSKNEMEEILLKGGGEAEEDTTTSPHLTTNNELFITCARPVDKEDWYFGLLAATEMMTESPTSHVEMMDKTHFDASAMQLLISTVQQDAEYREVQWLNAILGRLFLGLYKTDEARQYFQEKISKKITKIKRPSFLGEITVQSVDIGNAIPFVTQPKLLSLTPEGDLMAEAKLHYAGGLRVVIQTDFNWTYSSLMKPIKIPLVLSVTLKKLVGKFMLKVKPPPTNRYWIGFYELPVMDWEITPIVSDKQIRLSMVTNAIQSKIREFMMENIVLPNMDDFPFCPSGGKGGIFGERVPKPSSPKESAVHASPALSMDMLGNKVNQVPPPKVVVTQDSVDASSPRLPARRAESLGVLLDTPSMLTNQITRNRRSKSTSPSDSQHLAAVTSMLRSRGYSNPDILLRPANNSEGKANCTASSVLHEEEEEDVATAVHVEEESIAVTTPPSFTRRLSSNIVGFRKRHLQQQPQQQQEVVTVEDDILPDEPESYFPLDTANKKEVLQEETVITTTTAVVVTEDTAVITSPVAIVPVANIQVKQIEQEEREQIIIQQPQQPQQRKQKPQQDDSSSIKSNKSTATASTKINMLSKVISSKISSGTTKIINHPNTKKSSSALYHMAGNMFTSKKVKVTREMRDERNRELQESHNRKMMNLFFISEPSSPLSPSSPAIIDVLEEKQQPHKISVMPPPLPPRPTIIKTITSSASSSAESSSSSSEEEEEEMVSPSPAEQVSEASMVLPTSRIDLNHKEEEIFVVHHHQGLCL